MICYTWQMKQTQDLNQLRNLYDKHINRGIIPLITAKRLVILHKILY